MFYKLMYMPGFIWVIDFWVEKEDPEFSPTSSSENLVPSYGWDTGMVEMLYSDYLNTIYSVYTA